MRLLRCCVLQYYNKGAAWAPFTVLRFVRRGAQVWQFDVDITKFFTRLFVVQGQRNNHILAHGPVCRRCDRGAESGLQTVQRAQHFGKVTTNRQWLGHNQLYFFIGADDKHRPYRGAVGGGATIRQIGVGGQHIELF